MKAAAVLASLALAAALAGCGTSPEMRYYTLASEPAPPGAAAGYSIAVGPVSVPELVDRPHFVLRGAGNRVEIAEQTRWAAPLKSEIPRVVADHLARLLGAQASSAAQRAAGTPDYRVAIDVLRFEMSPGSTTVIEAQWTVRPHGGGEAVNGRTLATEAAGAGDDALVAAQSRALEALSRDIAAALSGLRKR